MEYNTSKKKLVLPEYGRNIQMMVDSLKEIDNREERNQAAKAIINIMGNMNPHLRDINDFRHKLWDHLFIMANFDLDIESPYPIPTRESFSDKPKPVHYNQHRVRFRHFGHIITELIKAATDFKDGEEKEILISVIANHMKKSYLMWNKEVVNDETIFAAISEISQGKLLADENVKLTSSRDIISRNRRKRIQKR